MNVDERVLVLVYPGCGVRSYPIEPDTSKNELQKLLMLVSSEGSLGRDGNKCS